MKDDLVDNLEGQWKLKGVILGQPGDSDFDAHWDPESSVDEDAREGNHVIPGRPMYEADVYLGYDNSSERYVLHWIDIYGGRYSETLGYGKRTGNMIKFVFEYPDGPSTRPSPGTRKQRPGAFCWSRKMNKGSGASLPIAPRRRSSDP